MNHIGAYLLQGAFRNLIVIEVAELRNAPCTHQFFGLCLVKRKATVSIVADFRDYDLNILLDWLAYRKEVPVALIISSDKIIHKVIHPENAPGHTEIIKDTLPGGNADEFYSQKFNLNPEQLFVSIIRKTSLEAVVNQLGEEIKSRLINISIGPWPALFTYPVIHQEQQESSLAFLNYHFLLSNDKLLDFKIDSFQPYEDHGNKLTIGGDQLEECLLISYSVALYLITNPTDPVGINRMETERLFDEFSFRKQSRKLILHAGALLCGILISSNALFTIYDMRLYSLQQSNELSMQKQNIRSRKLEDIKKIKEVLEMNGWHRDSKLSYYADQLTATLPEDIYLNKLEIHPKKTNSFSSPEHPFDGEMIFVKGNCFSNRELNDWVVSLKSLLWVRKVIIKEYEYAENENMGSFQIILLKQPF